MSLYKMVEDMYKTATISGSFEVIAHSGGTSSSNSYTYTNNGDKRKILAIAYGGSSNSGTANVTISLSGNGKTIVESAKQFNGSCMKSVAKIMEVDTGDTVSISISISSNYLQNYYLIIGL